MIRALTTTCSSLDPFGALRRKHHRDIITDFYARNIGILPLPKRIFAFDSWSDIEQNYSTLTQEDLIFVDGGILDRNLDVGNAILINDGGIIEGNISCGRFHKDGGIISGRITERLKDGEELIA